MMDHSHYLKLAYAEARKSKDRSTQNGAILVCPSTGCVVASGFNDIPDVCRDTSARRERPEKYVWTEHAERSSIFDAAKHGVATFGLVMYCPWLACADCGRAIVCAGIKRVVRHRIPQHDSRPDWAATIAAADQMFAESGVEVYEHRGELGESFLFAGQVIDV